MRLAAVTGCNLAFTDGVMVLLRDLKRFHSEVKRYCIAPAHEAHAMQAKLGELAEVFPAPRKIAVVPDSLQPALLKLFTPLVDADIACWLDGDMILCRPAPELWQVKPGEVVAVQDTAFKILFMVEPDLREQYVKQFPAIVEKPGFNGGLFALHCAEWKDLPERYEKMFIAGGYAKHPTIWDQPFLNGLMQPNVRYLPRAFNAHHVFDYPIPNDVRVVHFTSSPKPWHPGYPKHEPAYYYWLKYGLQETSFTKLAAAKLRIWLRTPQRLLGRYLRNHGVLRRYHLGKIQS